MRQALIRTAVDLRDLRDLLRTLSERADIADHFLDADYARGALRAQARDADRLAQSLRQLAAYRRPAPAALAEAKPPRLPGSLREPQPPSRREAALADPDAVLDALDPCTVSCSAGALRLRFALADTPADNAALATLLTDRGWTAHIGEWTGMQFWGRPGTIDERLAARAVPA